jgi:hypothetical protein
MSKAIKKTPQPRKVLKTKKVSRSRSVSPVRAMSRSRSVSPRRKSPGKVQPKKEIKKPAQPDFNNLIKRELLNRFHKCNHYTENNRGWYNAYGNAYGINNNQPGPYICETIMNLMLKAMDAGVVIDGAYIEQFYMLVTDRSYNSMPCCIQYNTIKLIDFTKKLFTYQMPPYNALHYILPYSIFNSCLMEIKDNNDFGLHASEYVNFLITKKLAKSNNSPEDVELFDFVMQYTDINVQNLILLCKCSNKTIMAKLLNIIKNYEGELNENIGPNFIGVACSNLPYTRDIIIALLHKNFQITSEDFDIVCRKGDYDDLKFILELSRVPITSKHFETVLGNGGGQNLNMIVELFFKYGFILKREDVKTSIKYRYEIPNIERFDNMIFDSEILKLCRNHNFSPKYKFSCITTEMLQLQGACKERDLGQVRQLIKSYNLVPDEICMENIASFKEGAITEYLISVGGKVNIECLKLRVKSYKSNKFLMIMLNALENQEKDIIKNYESKILELETKLANVNVVKEVEEVKEEEKIIKYNIVKVDVADDKLIEIRNKYKNKKVPHKNIMSFFEIDKTVKVSHIDFKKLLFDKIKNESWLCEDDKTLICIPIKYRKAFGFNDNDINNVVSFNDVDKLIVLFYINSCE